MADGEDIIDDTEAREEARAWAYGEIAGGREPEAVSAEMLASGWSQDAADEIVEEARKQSRHRRGVTTREDVASASEARYRGTMRHAGTGGDQWGFLGLLLSFFRSKKPPGGRPPSIR